jgi:peroxiredoxin
MLPGPARRRLARALARLVMLVGLVSFAGGATPVRADEARAQAWIGIAMARAATAAGVAVDHVIHGSPAEKAGIAPGDRLVQVGGATVTAPADVIRVLSLHAVGDTVAVVVARAGRQLTLSVVVADRPNGDALLRMDYVGYPAPAWDGLEPARGFPATLASLRGKVVILEFWATWCDSCREVSPVLGQWQSRYGAQGLRVAGITSDPLDAATQFKDQHDLRYPVASDPRTSTSSAYSVSALPTLFLLDRRGVVRDIVVGVSGGWDTRMQAFVEMLLTEPAPSP